MSAAPDRTDAGASREADRRRFAEVQRAFLEVASLEAGERAAALIRISASDPDLAEEVRSLVNAGEESGALLEAPAIGCSIVELSTEFDPDPVDSDDMAGTVLGPFRVLRKIDSGGMGSVYLAVREDGQFEQTVAIKVVKRGLDSREVLARFSTERQSLASLNHPNIARLLDGGVTPDGRPYLVLEYIDGVPIDQYCRDRDLRLTERLGLFRLVCDAVHHAHTHLVIHRDIKPGNILVTPAGVPKLLDFGIAKVLEHPGSTQTQSEAERRLTPDYASPEQFRGGSMTTATDIYSLGVVLYELLTGTNPYRVAAEQVEEMRRMVCEVEPPAPSEAVTILAGRRTGSPATAGARGTGGGVTAGRDGEAGLHGAGAGGSGAARAGEARRSTRLRGQLRGDLDTIVLMALRKEPSRRYVSAEQFGADITRYLEGLPVRARRDTVGYRVRKFVGRHSASVTLAVVSVLALCALTVVLLVQRGELRAQRDALLMSNSSLDGTREFLTDVLSGADTSNLGPDAKLGMLLEDAAGELERDPPKDARTRFAAQHAVGRALMSVGMLARARAMLESAAELSSSVGIDEGSRIDFEATRGELLFFEGHPAEAGQRFAALLDELAATDPSGPTALEGRLLNNLGSSQRLQRQFDEAIVSQRRAIATRIAVHGERSLPVAESRNNLASALTQRGDLSGALNEFTASLEIRRALLRPDHPLVARCLSNLGLVQHRTGASEEAVRTLEQAADLWPRAFGEQHPGIVPTLVSMGQALRAVGRADESIAAFERALAWQRAHQPEAITSTAATEANIAISLVSTQRYAEAIAVFERVVPVMRVGGESVGVTLRAAMRAHAEALDAVGREDEAAQMRRALPPEPDKP